MAERVRPANEMRNAIQDSLHKRTFQTWREMEGAFCLIGISGIAGKLQTAYSVGDISPIRNQLNTLVHRRNLIVHEGDLHRHKRGGKARPKLRAQVCRG